ncbi:YCF48-related protein [Telluria mixta]|uniref:YCF48-related protein n=1 Tax=Telluria mixta TaxID=34071 RepID=A0ABT2C1J3_9BURK|nr:YCF48-related protein [Telluria mixta]MCS0631239.1 YCF48-related protein [Telluria mixta]WEM95779.1 YCF48-related protein [Telluria mixta]
MRRAFQLFMSALPLMIVAGLLYAGFFIKPEPKGHAVPQPVFARGDNFYGVTAGGPGLVWAVGSNGKIARSGDGGRTWHLQPAAVRETLQDVAAWDAKHLVAVGNHGVVLITEDGGASWKNVDVPKSNIANKLVRVKAFSDGSAWATGEAGSVLHSTDFGKTWVQTGPGGDAAWNDIHVASNLLCLVGEFGQIKISDDGGASWKDSASPVKTSLMSVAFSDDSKGVAVGLGGTVLVTQDAGRNWAQETAASSDDLFRVMWDARRWLAVGANGTVAIRSVESSNWSTRRISALDRNWYTAIVRQGDSYYLGGSRVVAEPIAAL